MFDLALNLTQLNKQLYRDWQVLYFFYVGSIAVNYLHYPCDLALQVILSH